MIAAAAAAASAAAADKAGWYRQPRRAVSVVTESRSVSMSERWQDAQAYTRSGRARHAYRQSCSRQRDELTTDVDAHSATDTINYPALQLETD